MHGSLGIRNLVSVKIAQYLIATLLADGNHDIDIALRISTPVGIMVEQV
jgi:hypothetical protein